MWVKVISYIHRSYKGRYGVYMVSHLNTFTKTLNSDKLVMMKVFLASCSQCLLSTQTDKFCVFVFIPIWLCVSL